MADEKKLALYEHFRSINAIDPELYEKYDVKRGLRNADGTGVVAGITGIANVHGYVISDNEKLADKGSLRLRGYEIGDLLSVDDAGRRFNYEEIAYLLLMGDLPTKDQLDRFISVLDSQRELPDGFTASSIMRATPHDIMNALARSVLLLYSYDEHAEDRDIVHEIDTAISLISRLPRIMVLAYYAMRAQFPDRRRIVSTRHFHFLDLLVQLLVLRGARSVITPAFNSMRVCNIVFAFCIWLCKLTQIVHLSTVILWFAICCSRGGEYEVHAAMLLALRHYYQRSCDVVLAVFLWLYHRFSSCLECCKVYSRIPSL